MSFKEDKLSTFKDIQALSMRVAAVSIQHLMPLKVADLHGVVNKAMGYSKELRFGADKFLVLRLRPEPGALIGEGVESWHPKGCAPTAERNVPGPHEVEVSPAFTSVATSPDGMEIRPPGLHLEFRLAGIEVPHQDIFSQRKHPFNY